jgi:hypothetical protein
MHSDELEHDCLTAVLTAQEAATLWGLSRNAISDACRRGALRGVFGAKGRKRTLRLSQIAVDADLLGPSHHLYRSEIYRTD